MFDKLPYEIIARVAAGESATFIAIRDGQQVAIERYTPGNGLRRRAVAEQWCADPRLLDGAPITAATVEAALQDAEIRAMSAIDEGKDTDPTVVPEGSSADDGDSGHERLSAATKLVGYVRRVADLFHDAGGTAYATIALADRQETHPLRSAKFRAWVRKLYFDRQHRAATSNAMIDAIGTLEGYALHEGRTHEVSIRTAGRDGSVFLDLCDPDWHCAEVTSKGWRVIPVSAAPVMFVRRPGMLALPIPASGGSINALRDLVNVADDDAWQLVIGWLLMTFRPVGPYPILLVNGEQGSAKSTLCRMLRSLIDPNDCPLRRPPREDRDLLIAARNSWCLAYDNLSGLAPWHSDALCMIATGGGFATRTLYDDDSETRFNTMRPIIANGIDEIATRADLLDRALCVTLPKIAGTYREEADLWREFNERRPAILGALLTAVSQALADEKTIRLANRPRMIDFARWVEAAAPALGWERGSFLQAYMGNRTAGNDAAIEGSPIGPAIVAMMGSRSEWSGIAAELLGELEHFATDRDRRRRDWPTTPKMLAAALRRVAPNLRAQGVEVELPEKATGRAHRREIRITSRPREEDTGFGDVDFAGYANPTGAIENVDSCEPNKNPANPTRSQDQSLTSQGSPIGAIENADAKPAKSTNPRNGQSSDDGNGRLPGWSPEALASTREAANGKIHATPIVPVQLFDPQVFEAHVDVARIPEG